MPKLKVKDLIPDDANFNTGTEFGNSLIDKSLSKFGAGRSILIDKNNRIIAGNKTIENAAANGFNDIVVVETTGEQIVAVKRTDIDLNTKKGREMALADNATAKANISWDAQTLTEWEMPLQEWGIDLSDITEVEPDGEADAEPQIDKAAELNKKWGVGSGDLWQIGEHRLLCGDCTDRDSVGDLIDGQPMQLCLTDPPYANKEAYDTHDDTVQELALLIAGFLPIATDASEVVLLTPGNANQRLYPTPNWTLAWVVPAGTGSGPWGFSCWQPVLAYGKDPFLANGKGRRPDLLNLTEKADNDTGHPCSKPVKVWQWFLERGSVNEGDRVYEPFAGSGTTLVACQNLNRKCYAIEISENYCAVILERMATAFPELEIKRIDG